MLNKKKQLGQGMTEYIIIVALIAISAITVYNLFGDTVRGQVGNMTAELGGGTGNTDPIDDATIDAAASADASDLQSFDQTEN